jgi:two-component system, LytTR family, response regulator LytT
MKIAICDDDQQQRERIQQYIKLSSIKCTDFEIVQFCCGEDLIKAYSENVTYDIIFLDIVMENLDGIKTADSIHKINTSALIIFISSYVQFVSETFRLHAFQFLIKPITRESFDREFERAVNQFYAQHRKLIFKTSCNTVAVEIKDIVYIEGYQHHLYVVTKNKNEYMVTGKLSEKEKQLLPFGFVRVHQSFLVNMDFIKSINDKNVVTTVGVTVEMSTRKKSQVLNLFNKYLVGQVI